MNVKVIEAENVRNIQDALNVDYNYFAISGASRDGAGVFSPSYVINLDELAREDNGAGVWTNLYVIDADQVLTYYNGLSATEKADVDSRADFFLDGSTQNIFTWLDNTKVDISTVNILKPL